MNEMWSVIITILIVTVVINGMMMKWILSKEGYYDQKIKNIHIYLDEILKIESLDVRAMTLEKIRQRILREGK